MQVQHILMALVLVTQLLVYNVHLTIMDHVAVNVRVMQKIVTHNVIVMVWLVANVCQRLLVLVIVYLVANVPVIQNLVLDIVLVIR